MELQAISVEALKSTNKPQAFLSNESRLSPAGIFPKKLAPGVPLGEARSGNADTAGCVRAAVQRLDANKNSYYLSFMFLRQVERSKSDTRLQGCWAADKRVLKWSSASQQPVPSCGRVENESLPRQVDIFRF